MIIDIILIAVYSFKDQFDLPLRQEGGGCMGLLDAVKDQFLDVIEDVDQSNKLIVSKYRRESGNNELKQASKVIVRESQNAVF